MSQLPWQVSKVFVACIVAFFLLGRLGRRDEVVFIISGVGTYGFLSFHLALLATEKIFLV